MNLPTDATIVSYAENPTTATEIKAAHITELRTAINAVRSLAGQSAGSWTHSGLGYGDFIYADDVRDLRSQLNDALVAMGIQTSSYTDNTILSYAADPLNATVFKAVHIRELRTRATSGGGNSTSGGASGGLHYVLSDLQGTTRAVMNNNGSSSAVVARHDYLPFGEEIGSSLGLRSSTPGYATSDANRWKYGMLQRDASTGLDHAGWRKFETLSGRWTSPDPLHGSIGDPQSLNGYNYTGNDPVSFIDPDGLDPVSAARRLLQNASCRRLFGKTNSTALLDSYVKDKRIRTSNGIPTSYRGTGKAITFFGSKPFGAAAMMTIDASASAVGRFRNPFIFMSTSFLSGLASGTVYGGSWDGLSSDEVSGLTLIHELLHAVNKIPYDGGGSPQADAQSQLNNWLVAEFCVKIPNKQVSTPSGVPQDFIIPQALIGSIGGGTLGTLMASAQFTNWIDSIGFGTWNNEGFVGPPPSKPKLKPQ